MKAQKYKSLDLGGPRKQVSIVEVGDHQTARRKRDAFKRQDTPIHPEVLNSGCVLRRPTVLKSLSANEKTEESIRLAPPSTGCIRSSSCDERLKSPAPRPLTSSGRQRNTENLALTPSPRSVSRASSHTRSSISSNPSFMCSIDFAGSDSCEATGSETDPGVADEFAQFVKASIHPPNELSLPRCYPGSSTGTSPRHCSTSPRSPSPSRSPTSPSHLSPRPRLRRESAQDLPDEEQHQARGYSPSLSPSHRGLSTSPIQRGLSLSTSPVGKGLSLNTSPVGRGLSPGISVELVDSDIRQETTTEDRKARLRHQRSAPGTPLSCPCKPGPSSRTPSRTPSDETCSGLLSVPHHRARGASLPEDMEDSLHRNNCYLLRQFDIQGRRVVHLGDCYQHRASSSMSVNSILSRNSSVSRHLSSGNSSLEEEIGSHCPARDSMASLDGEVAGGLLVRQGSQGLSLEYAPTVQSHRVLVVGSGGVGKSCLVQKFLSPDYVYTYESNQESDTEQSVCIMLEDIETEVIFQDLSSEEIQVADSLLPGSPWQDCHCVLVVFSVTDAGSLVEAERLLQGLWQCGDLNTKAVIVVGNKIDLVRNREVPIHEARCLASSHDCKYVEVSAGLNHNVDTLLVGIVKQIRLKINKQAMTNLKNRRKSAQVRVRGIIDKILGQEKKSKSCENLNVI